ncbi:MAG: rRNA methylase [Chlamydiales bacterium]|jgi:TrmH family RNA methyltransferase|nr:rRNA methylase [Chlamydiales bacterium]
MQPLFLSSTANPKIKAVEALYNRRDRDREGRFLIEGYREISRALSGGQKIESLYYAEDLFLGSNEYALIEAVQKSGATLYACNEKAFRKISYRDRPDGLIAIAEQNRRGLKELEEYLQTLKSPPFLIIAEAIEKPGNLGTILRSCDAAKADALIVADRCTDPYNPNVVRASVGTLFTIPVFETSSIELIDWLKSRQIHILAATPHATQSLYEAPLKEAVAIAVGTEQIGLSELWMNAADLQVKIPMCGQADSLNVAMATTLLTFEVRRQRTHL